MSYTMETNIHMIASTLPIKYRQQIEAEDGQYEDTDEVPDVPVEVEYNAGWYTAAKTYGLPEDCYPSEGEDPEITSVKIDGVHEFVNDVTAQDLTSLVEMAWEDQKEQNEQDFGECDDYDGGPEDYPDGP